MDFYQPNSQIFQSDLEIVRLSCGYGYRCKVGQVCFCHQNIHPTPIEAYVAACYQQVRWFVEDSEDIHCLLDPRSNKILAQSEPDVDLFGQVVGMNVRDLILAPEAIADHRQEILNTGFHRQVFQALSTTGDEFECVVEESALIVPYTSTVLHIVQVGL